MRGETTKDQLRMVAMDSTRRASLSVGSWVQDEPAVMLTLQGNSRLFAARKILQSKHSTARSGNYTD